MQQKLLRVIKVDDMSCRIALVESALRAGRAIPGFAFPTGDEELIGLAIDAMFDHLSLDAAFHLLNVVSQRGLVARMRTVVQEALQNGTTKPTTLLLEAVCRGSYKAFVLLVESGYPVGPCSAKAATGAELDSPLHLASRRSMRMYIRSCFNVHLVLANSLSIV
jgi:hypothetical protein